MKKALFGMLLAVIFTISLAGCGGNEKASENDNASGNEEKKVIKIGTSAGPHEEITNVVKELAAKEGLELEVISFNDFIVPNRALDKGEIDVNAYQNLPFLKQFNKDHKTDIVPVGKTNAMLMGLYSKKYKSVEELPDGATVGLQNDPVNRSRALFVYQNAGLIKLKPGTDEDKATVQDIAENPKGLKFKEMEAGMLARTLTSLDASSINGSYALQEGFDPKEDAIYLNNEDRYANVVAVNREDQDNEVYKRIVELYTSEEVKKFIDEKYNGVVMVAEDPFTFDFE